MQSELIPTNNSERLWQRRESKFDDAAAAVDDDVVAF